MSSERIEELQKQIADLNRRWPAHSAPPSMMEELDDLEAALKEELAKLAQEHGAQGEGSK